MTGFLPETRTLSGHILLPGSVERIFPLFSPLGERDWVPGWDPELLHPAGVEWAEGMVFRTREDLGPGIWMATRLDRAGHRAEYVRVEPERYVAQVRVHCVAHDAEQVRASVTYTFVGLNDRGNRDIAAMTDEGYAAKLAQWRLWILGHFERTGESGRRLS